MKAESLIKAIDAKFKKINAKSKTIALDATLVTPHFDVLVARGYIKAEKADLSVEILIEQGEIYAVRSNKALLAPEITSLSTKKRSITIGEKVIPFKINYEQMRHLENYLNHHRWETSLSQTWVDEIRTTGCTGINVTISCATSDLVKIHIKIDYFGGAQIDPNKAASYLIPPENIDSLTGAAGTSEMIHTAIRELSQPKQNTNATLFRPVQQQRPAPAARMETTLATITEEDVDEGYVTPPLRQTPNSK
jgi:hypothetical protein